MINLIEMNSRRKLGLRNSKLEKTNNVFASRVAERGRDVEGDALWEGTHWQWASEQVAVNSIDVLKRLDESLLLLNP